MTLAIALGVFCTSVSVRADQELSQAANDPAALLQAHLLLAYSFRF